MFSVKKRVSDLVRAAWPAPVILMYHRVAEAKIDPWGLAVSSAHFDEHMDFLRRSRRVMPLTELVEAYKRRALPRGAVAVTFDDGYVDNLLNAKPILTRYGIPATLFLTTGMIGSSAEYWWDELARMILLSLTSVKAELQIGAEIIQLQITPDDGTGRDWRAWKAPTNARQATYLEVWKKLRSLNATELSKAMASLRPLFGGSGPPSATDLPMSVAQVSELVDDGLVELGGHTVSHPLLPSLSLEERKREIAEGKASCEALIGRRIDGFAFPYGGFDDPSKMLARECGFSWACTTEGYSLPRTAADLYILPRVQVLDWDNEGFSQAL